MRLDDLVCSTCVVVYAYLSSFCLFVVFGCLRVCL